MHRYAAVPRPSRHTARKALGMRVVGVLGLAAIMAIQTAAAGDARSVSPPLPYASEVPIAAPLPAKRSTGKRPDFGLQAASEDVLGLAVWIVDSADNQGMPFMVVDKVNAQVLMFDTEGRLKGATPALLGLARGDDSTPGIGDRKLSSIQPHERTTPAGRFVASLDRDIHDIEILWIDYATAFSLHRVVKGTPLEQRAQRLASETTADNRVSFGCINVPVSFYDKVVSPAFTGSNGVVYILPETRTAQEVFGSYAVGNRLAQAANSGDAPLAGPATPAR